MNYVILDLEWNSAYSKRHERFINEIVEIGAVKLNENLEEIDSFKVVVRSCLTSHLSGRFKRLTNITNEEMQGGVPFAQGLREYTNWVDKSDITMTWSDSDLYAFLENCRIFAETERIPCIYGYVDLQRFAQNEMKHMDIPVGDNQISLGAAAELLGIDISDAQLHRAQGDCRLCGMILRKLYNKEQLIALVKDTTADDFYTRLTYKPYFINDINSPHVDRGEMKFFCPECEGRVTPNGKWQYKGNAFRRPFACEKCEHKFIGRVAFKKLYDSVKIKKGTSPFTKPAEGEQDETNKAD